MDERLTQAVQARNAMNALKATEGWRLHLEVMEETRSRRATPLIEGKLEKLDEVLDLAIETLREPKEEEAT